jgi:hypothetical protein
MAQWSKAKKALRPDFVSKNVEDILDHELYDTLPGIYDNKWSINSQILNISEVSDLINIPKPVLHEYLPSTHSMIKYILILWNIILTLLVFYLLIRSLGLSMMMPFPMIKALKQPDTGRSEDVHDYYQFLTILPFLAILVLILLTWFLYRKLFYKPPVQRTIKRRQLPRLTNHIQQPGQVINNPPDPPAADPYDFLA